MNNLKWLWKISDGFRPAIACSALTGTLHVCVSLAFVYVCKHLIDIATGISDDRLGSYIGWLASCLAMQLLLSAARSRLTAQTEIRLRNELRRKLFVHLMDSRWNGQEKENGWV